MRKVNVPVMGHLLFLFMTIECTIREQSIVINKKSKSHITGTFTILICIYI